MIKSKNTKSTTFDSLKVITSDHKVGKKYFSFNYKIFANGKIYGTGSYDSSHSRSPSTIRKYLKEGYAANLVLESVDLTKAVK